MTTFEPIPTEYAGITFRSKSEAVFARALDLLGWLWQYEPKEFQTGDLWTPDFITVYPGTEHGLALWIIEYKPSHPTDAYMALMKKRAAELGPYIRGFLLLVFHGSTFNEDFGGSVWNDANDFYPAPKPMMDALITAIREAARYRFDLQSPP